MPITDGVKLFDKSRALAKDSGDATASSGDASADLMLSMEREVRWDSVGSNDATVETITITFTSVTIDRLFLVDHNLKDFNITFGAGASSFTNVIGINGPTSGISEANFAEDTAYYEFDSITTDQINITANTTQVPNEDKHITLMAVMEELGTFIGFVKLKPATTGNEKSFKTQTGKSITQKGFEAFDCSFALEYIEQADMDLITTAYESQEPFLVWLCGGKFGTSSFSVEQKNWRLKDLYQVQTFGKIPTPWDRNVYTSRPKTRIRLQEEV